VRLLAGKLRGIDRYRVGEHRLIFEIDPALKLIQVMLVEPRGSAY
jgi:mRNA-degrading endonuclease RelE of RelBE toxin-antitoxin system